MRPKRRQFIAILAASVLTSLPQISSAFCSPPVAPPLTSEALAKEFRDEFRQDFEQYFSDAQGYLRCLEEERAEVMVEVRETADRYQRFLNDAQHWEPLN